MTILNYLRRLDAYPKTLEEARIKTVGGAAVTIVCFFIMALLIFSEFRIYMTQDIFEELFVDTTRNNRLKINLDVYIPNISCEYISLDAMDSAGDQHLHIEHNIYKRRLDLNGNPVQDPIKEEIATSKTKKIINVTEVAEVKCGSCYNAHINETHCCNTCQDVIDAYRERKWHPNIEDFDQCKNERKNDKEKAKAAFNEGCQVYGHMEVNRFSGGFHIAPGKSFSLNHIHVHDVQPFSSTTFNTSHVINHLSFGERINFANTHPLDTTEVTAKEGAMMFQYYIKIIPTMYVKQNGDVLNTNQFSVTKHQKSVSVISGETGMPGVFFSYELSPLMVKYTEKENSLGHFLTTVCAIVGGIFTVAGIIDSFLHNYVISKKVELGKFS